MPLPTLLKPQGPHMPRGTITMRGDPVRGDSVRNGKPSAPDSDALDKAVISEISAMLIARMTDEELIRVISAGGRPFLDRGTWPHLEYLDRPTLERLAYLARHCCQNGGY